MQATTTQVASIELSNFDKFKENQIIRKTIGIKIKNTSDELRQQQFDENDMKLYRINVDESETMKI